jgi:hypothetical protein
MVDRLNSPEYSRESGSDNDTSPIKQSPATARETASPRPLDPIELIPVEAVAPDPPASSGNQGSSSSGSGGGADDANPPAGTGGSGSASGSGGYVPPKGRPTTKRETEEQAATSEGAIRAGDLKSEPVPRAAQSGASPTEPAPVAPAAPFAVEGLSGNVTARVAGQEDASDSSGSESAPLPDPVIDTAAARTPIDPTLGGQRPDAFTRVSRDEIIQQGLPGSTGSSSVPGSDLITEGLTGGGQGQRAANLLDLTGGSVADPLSTDLLSPRQGSGNVDWLTADHIPWMTWTETDPATGVTTTTRQDFDPSGKMWMETVTETDADGNEVGQVVTINGKKYVKDPKTGQLVPASDDEGEGQMAKAGGEQEEGGDDEGAGEPEGDDNADTGDENSDTGDDTGAAGGDDAAGAGEDPGTQEPSTSGDRLTPDFDGHSPSGQIFEAQRAFYNQIRLDAIANSEVNPVREGAEVVSRDGRQLEVVGLKDPPKDGAPAGSDVASDLGPPGNTSDNIDYGPDHVEQPQDPGMDPRLFEDKSANRDDGVSEQGAVADGYGRSLEEQVLGSLGSTQSPQPLITGDMPVKVSGIQPTVGDTTAQSESVPPASEPIQQMYVVPTELTEKVVPEEWLSIDEPDDSLVDDPTYDDDE